MTYHTEKKCHDEESNCSGIILILVKAAASRRGCESGASRGAVKITSEQAGRKAKAGAAYLAALTESGNGGRPSSSARGSYVTGNRIICDGV